MSRFTWHCGRSCCSLLHTQGRVKAGDTELRLLIAFSLGVADEFHRMFSALATTEGARLCPEIALLADRSFIAASILHCFVDGRAAKDTADSATTCMFTPVFQDVPSPVVGREEVLFGEFRSLAILLPPAAGWLIRRYAESAPFGPIRKPRKPGTCTSSERR